MKRRPKIVCLGGGTGTYQVLLGLRQFPVDLTAVVTMSDSGGSSGRLRKELGILPPGDARRALLALSGLRIKKKTLNALFDFRFDNGELAGHSLGNLLLAALMQITGRTDIAISEAARILEVSGQVLPVTTGKTELIARLKDGTIIRGETNIDVRDIKPKVPIEEIYLSPKGRIFSETKKAILKADLIALGPGDLYTSIIPNLLVSGVNKAIKDSKAKVILIVNLMTKHGETNGFKASDFVREIKKYLGPAGKRLNYALVSKKVKVTPKTLRWYKKYKAELVKNDLGQGKNFNVVVIVRDFSQKGNLLRHDSQKLARAIIKLL
ncbi:MAG TPA: gluconeogenesis factor YvcK family protein [Patescibacteria group bacterium]|nr:gluconeogenesis factor YvcK family protein [Patescibacteria group bacterium]